MRCRTNPIQKEVPKNCVGVRPENRPVAKKIPTIGRMVATARPIANARIIHWRCSVTSRSRMCQNALLSANRKKEPNRIVAAAWFTPPMDCMVKLINNDTDCGTSSERIAATDATYASVAVCGPVSAASAGNARFAKRPRAARTKAERITTPRAAAAAEHPA